MNTPTTLTPQPEIKAGHGLPVYAGNGKIYPKRMPGRFRRLKHWTASFWLLFFFGPYLQWEGHQAVLLDIPHRRFQFFDLTVMPEDIWLLTFVLLFLAMLLFIVTVVAGRAFCGYVCFQTVWTDLYTWIETLIEGPPRARQQLDRAPWGMRKLLTKSAKHLLWLLIAALTGVSFAAWFTDARQLWVDYFALDAHPAAWIILAMFTAGTYLFAGFMREQVCFWLCPYARIQGVMYGDQTILPTYNYLRGEPRQHRSTKQANQAGDCIDCGLCVAVCPTGIDIRDGQQIGCITCGLCIDACDHVMTRIDRPTGLIRYSSLASLASGNKGPSIPILQVTVSLAILASCLLIIILGINNIGDTNLNIYHYRQPLFITMSSGDIRNRYRIKIQNRSQVPAHYQILVSGLENARIMGQSNLAIAAETTRVADIFLELSKSQLPTGITPITFRLIRQGGAVIEYRSVFIGPDAAAPGGTS